MSEDVLTLVPDKDQIRKRVWDALQQERVARFPGAWGRIPNFAGASAAADRLRELDAWNSARVIKANPDSPQLPLRRAALREGKVVYMAVPRLRQEECFLELDPDFIGDNISRAATIKGAFAHGRPVRPDQMRPVDLILCGCVAVTAEGARLGKGGGYSDLEYAIVMEFGKAGPETPIVTTVHPLQLQDRLPVRRHDIPVDFIATPDELIACRSPYARPSGISWDLLSRERVDEIPALQRLRARISG